MKIHEHAVALAKTIHTTENKLVEAIIEIDEKKIYQNFGHASLFNYVTIELEFSEARTYELINVSRKAAQVPELRTALSTVQISIPKANRIVSSLTKENAKDLIEYASTHTTRETEKLLVTMNPKRKKNAQLSEEVLHLMKVASEIANMSKEEATIKALKEFIEKRSKTREPKRVSKVKAQTPTPNKRQAIPAATERTTYKTYKEQCAIKDHRGQRCPNHRFLHMHHIQDVALGGTNDADNLILICSEHHELIHQQQFALEDAVDWRKKVEEARISV